MPYVPRRVEPRALCREVALFIQANSLGTYGTSIRLWRLPNTPYVCQAIAPQGGPKIPSSPLDYIRFQWLGRDIDVTSAAALTQLVYVALADRKPDLPSFAGFITAEHAPGLRYQDENNLEVFSLNFLFTGTVRVI